jgi:hypothetical protein
MFSPLAVIAIGGGVALVTAGVMVQVHAWSTKKAQRQAKFALLQQSDAGSRYIARSLQTVAKCCVALRPKNELTKSERRLL